MEHDNLTWRIAFSSLRGLRPELAQMLLARAGSEQAFFNLTEGQLSAMMGFKNRLFSDSLRGKALDRAAAEAEFIRANSITPLYFLDPDYPNRLLQCDDAPLMLYGLGTCDLNDAHFISIVGTRHATVYGTDFVTRLVEDIAAKATGNVVIVSGLAYGIDIAAHRAALRAGLPTIAVLAHGLSTIYPATHRSDAVEIVRRGGMLLTDYTSAEPIHRGNFLARNRIVAGLSDCLIVAESADKGGALVTARLAAGYDRDVMALPGRVTDRYSAGCNSLIAGNIAALITSADDLFTHMGWTVREPEGTQKTLFETLTPDEETIISILTDIGEASMTDLTTRLDIPTPRLMGMLIDMEFRSLIAHIPGGRYRAILT